MKTPTHIVVGVLLTMMFLIMLFLGWAEFFEKPWLSYTNDPFPLVFPKQHAGEVLTITVGRCNSDKHKRQYSTTRVIQAVGTSNALILPTVSVSIDPGCLPVVSTLTVLPKKLPPGKYTLSGASTINGLIRTHVVEWRSQEFEVVP